MIITKIKINLFGAPTKHGNTFGKDAAYENRSGVCWLQTEKKNPKGFPIRSESKKKKKPKRRFK